jgi:hypothetical protein
MRRGHKTALHPFRFNPNASDCTRGIVSRTQVDTPDASTRRLILDASLSWSDCSPPSPIHRWRRSYRIITAPYSQLGRRDFHPLVRRFPRRTYVPAQGAESFIPPPHQLHLLYVNMCRNLSQSNSELSISLIITLPFTPGRVTVSDGPSGLSSLTNPAFDGNRTRASLNRIRNSSPDSLQGNVVRPGVEVFLSLINVSLSSLM